MPRCLATPAPRLLRDWNRLLWRRPRLRLRSRAVAASGFAPGSASRTRLKGRGCRRRIGKSGSACAPLNGREQVAAIAQETDVASRKPVDRLPVVAHQEVSRIRASEGLEQLHPPGGYVLELVHQHVSVLRLPSALSDLLCGKVDKVMEVPRFLVRKQLLVADAHLVENVKEGLVAPTVSVLTGTGAQVGGRQASALDVVQKGSDLTP